MATSLFHLGGMGFDKLSPNGTVALSPNTPNPFGLSLSKALPRKPGAPS